jgi:hypothetical protein
VHIGCVGSIGYSCQKVPADSAIIGSIDPEVQGAHGRKDASLVDLHRRQNDCLRQLQGDPIPVVSRDQELGCSCVGPNSRIIIWGAKLPPLRSWQDPVKQVVGLVAGLLCAPVHQVSVAGLDSRGRVC